MYSRNSFGDFYPVDSVIHKINPIIKFISFFICIVVSIGSTSFEIQFFAISLLFIMILFSNVPFRFYFNSLYSLRFIFIVLFIILFFLKFTLSDIVLVYMKIILLIEYLNIITYTTSSSELYYGIGMILSFFNILSLNLDKVSLKIVNILRFVPLFINSEYKILKTQASRGIDYNNSDLFGKIYAYSSSLKNVFRIYKYNKNKFNEVSWIRMFNIKRKRTNLRVNYVGFYDFIFLAFYIAILIGYIFERGLVS